MGLTSVRMQVANFAAPDIAEEVEFLVDSGAIYSVVPGDILARLGLGTLANVIHPYPTQAEAIRKTADAYNRTRLTPTVKKAFQRWLAWTR